MKRLSISMLTIAAMVLAFAFSATTFAGNTETYCLCHSNNAGEQSWVKVKDGGLLDTDDCAIAQGCESDDPIGEYLCDDDGETTDAVVYDGMGSGSLLAHVNHDDENEEFEVILTTDLSMCSNSSRFRD